MSKGGKTKLVSQFGEGSNVKKKRGEEEEEKKRRKKKSKKAKKSMELIWNL